MSNFDSHHAMAEASGTPVADNLATALNPSTNPDSATADLDGDADVSTGVGAIMFLLRKRKAIDDTANTSDSNKLSIKRQKAHAGDHPRVRRARNPAHVRRMVPMSAEEREAYAHLANLQRDAGALDGLPQELLDNIWRQIFVGTRVTFKKSPATNRIPDRLAWWRDGFPFTRISKKHSRDAKRAMLEHATVLVPATDVALLLAQCKEIAEIRHIQLCVPSTVCNSFTLMDDFFRALTSLRTLRIDTFVRHSRRQHSNLAELMDKEALWTGRLLLQVLTRSRELPIHKAVELDLDWLYDILRGEAFLGWEKAPAVQVTVGFEIEKADNTYSFSENENGTIDTSPSVYHFGSGLLTGTRGGRQVSAKQRIPSFTGFRRRGGRAMLCDASMPNTVVRSLVESIIGHPLGEVDQRELWRFAWFEADRNCDSNPWDLDIDREVYLAACELYAFDQENPSCRKLIAWLEQRSVPELQIENAEQAQDLIVVVDPRTRPIPQYVGYFFQQAFNQMLEQAWDRSEPIIRRGRHPRTFEFANTLQVYQFVTSLIQLCTGRRCRVLDAAAGTDFPRLIKASYYRRCFDRLYKLPTRPGTEAVTKHMSLEAERLRPSDPVAAMDLTWAIKYMATGGLWQHSGMATDFANLFD
ncbi:uncharacterized protein AB675_4672 [Cyphellophora attinorum]|uniref:Uncharacterized protein n=1 Tax=Cyphellophora attinorum TaxID=1664694 RepID=A0A0N1NY41_9EURO|nr:uncharacterized protein AB675_4672 [Phialophora attinorum]KPI39183.1 hypothetical protein AB675_4672 [Phialophora attinorum]